MVCHVGRVDYLASFSSSLDFFYMRFNVESVLDRLSLCSCLMGPRGNGTGSS